MTAKNCTLQDKISAMKRILTLFVIVLLLTTAYDSHAQGKIGYISTEEVFSAMPEVNKADSFLAAFQGELATNYQQQQNELNDAYAKFVKDSSTMTASMKEIKRTDLQNRITGLQTREQELNKILENEKEKQLKPIREKMLKAIKDVAKENGYVHVFYKEQAIVFPEADDITAKVKKKLGIK
jgi:outer membrane protein